MFDTHCHLGFDQFDGRRAALVADARAAGVRGMITVSVTSADCARNRAIVRELGGPAAGLWCSAGVHPLYADEPVDWNAVRDAGAAKECVAWGELGLDNHYDRPPRPTQDRVLAEQLAMIEAARSDGLERPVILHCREAFDDLLAVLRETTLDRHRFVFHCFTGDADDARKVLDFGAWISFTGVVTFANAKDVAEAATLVPADRIMVETDAPFLTPEPHRTVRPNEPKFVVHTAARLAELRGVDPTDFEAILDANAQRFFGIEIP